MGAQSRVGDYSRKGGYLIAKCLGWVLIRLYALIWRGYLTLPTMGLLEQPQILGGGHNVPPPISYACSTCAILMKLSEFK